MIARRNVLFFALLPLGLIGGAALRAKEKVMASPVIPNRWRGHDLIEYLWTDGTESWTNGHDVPAGTKNVVMKIIWHKD